VEVDNSEAQDESTPNLRGIMSSVRCPRQDLLYRAHRAVRSVFTLAPRLVASRANIIRAPRGASRARYRVRVLSLACLTRMRAREPRVRSCEKFECPWPLASRRLFKYSALSPRAFCTRVLPPYKKKKSKSITSDLNIHIILRNDVKELDIRSSCKEKKIDRKFF